MHSSNLIQRWTSSAELPQLCLYRHSKWFELKWNKLMWIKLPLFFFKWTSIFQSKWIFKSWKMFCFLSHKKVYIRSKKRENILCTAEIHNNDIIREHNFPLIFFACTFYLLSFSLDASHHDSDSRPFNLSPPFYGVKKSRMFLKKNSPPQKESIEKVKAKQWIKNEMKRTNYEKKMLPQYTNSIQSVEKSIYQ